MTLLSETVLRFTRLGVDSLATQLMLTAGIAAVLGRVITLGGLLAFFAYADMFARGCTTSQEFLTSLCTARPACTRYFELLDRVPRMEYGSGTIPAACAGGIELRNVSFGYPGRSEGALRRVDLTITPGETLAVVGPSGAGNQR